MTNVFLNLIYRPIYSSDALYCVGFYF